MTTTRTRTTGKMQWSEEIMNHIPCHISGIYKCVNYGGAWFAFFKPKGWECWGNSCEISDRGASKTYDTLDDAKEACERHNKKS